MKKRQLLVGLMAAMIVLPGMAMAASTEDKAEYKEKPGIHAEHKNPFLDLDEEVREALKELKKQVIAGDITKAEFQEQMKELLPEDFEFRAKDKKDGPKNIKKDFREKRELTEEQKEFFEARKDAPRGHRPHKKSKEAKQDQ